MPGPTCAARNVQLGLTTYGLSFFSTRPSYSRLSTTASTITGPSVAKALERVTELAGLRVLDGDTEEVVAADRACAHRRAVDRVALLLLLDADEREIVVGQHDDDDLQLYRTAVAISPTVIRNPPSPTTAHTRRSGWTSFAAIAAGNPKPIVDQPLS